MNKHKIIFAAIAVLVILCCLLPFLLKRQQDDSSISTTDAAGTTQSTAPQEQEPSAATETVDLSDVEIPTLPIETIPQIIVGNDVTIEQVPKDPNEVIDRNQVMDPTDPEYLNVTGGDPYFNLEGKVCRNDKVISISVQDALTDEQIKISFGHITGRCNRFLYLNPVMYTNGEITQGYFHFRYIVTGGGYQITVADRDATGDSYTYNTTLEDAYAANYTDPKHPGAVWFPHSILEGPIYLDVIVNNAQGRLIATLRLTIDKAEDGTYALADIDNLNIIQNPQLYPQFTESELNHILDLANEVWFDPSQTKIHDISGNTGFTMNQCIIEYMVPDFRLYYDTFVPGADTVPETKPYADLMIPMVAVTLRKWNSSYTLYFLVYSEPTPDSHGIYQYVGRDHILAAVYR